MRNSRCVYGLRGSASGYNPFLGGTGLGRVFAEATETEAHIAIKELLNLAFIRLTDGIKEETVIHLAKYKRVTRDVVAMDWSRSNKGMPPNESTTKRRAARDNAYNDAA